MSTRRQGTTLFSAILILVATTVVVQLWLLSFSMEALLRHQFKPLIPAAVASTVLLLINGGLLRYVFRFDREVQRNSEG
jgi:CHASE2 domain-containing sensor protein